MGSKKSFEKSFDWPLLQSFVPQETEYLYADEASRLLQMMKSLHEQDLANRSQLKQLPYAASQSGRTFAITGERGNGKTTFLNYLLVQIHENAKDFMVLPPINPTNFNDHLSVLEAMIANIKSQLEQHDCESRENVFERNQLEKTIQKAMHAVALVRIKRMTAANSQSARDYLADSLQLKDISVDVSHKM